MKKVAIDKIIIKNQNKKPDPIDLKYLSAQVAEYLIDYQIIVPVDKFVSFFKGEPKYTDYVNKRKGRKTKFLLNNAVVNYDIITKDFIARILHPNGSSYMAFKINYRAKNRLGFRQSKKNLLTKFTRRSFFASSQAILKHAYVFYYRKRRKSLKYISPRRMVRRFNSKARRISIMFFFQENLVKRNFMLPVAKVYDHFVKRRYFWINKKINMGLIETKSFYKYWSLLQHEYTSPDDRSSRINNKNKRVISKLMRKVTSLYIYRNKIVDKRRLLIAFKKAIRKKYLLRNFRKISKIRHKAAFQKLNFRIKLLVKFCFIRLRKINKAIKKQRRIQNKKIKKKFKDWKRQFKSLKKTLSFAYLSTKERKRKTLSKMLKRQRLTMPKYFRIKRINKDRYRNTK